MYDHRRILDLLTRAKPGHTLPQPFYRDPDLYEFDVSAVFSRSWLMLGFEAEGYIARRDSYEITPEVNPETGEIIHLHSIELSKPSLARD